MSDLCLSNKFAFVLLFCSYVKLMSVVNHVCVWCQPHFFLRSIVREWHRLCEKKNTINWADSSLTAYYVDGLGFFTYRDGYSVSRKIYRTLTKFDMPLCLVFLNTKNNFFNDKNNGRIFSQKKQDSTTLELTIDSKTTRLIFYVPNDWNHQYIYLKETNFKTID